MPKFNDVDPNMYPGNGNNAATFKGVADVAGGIPIANMVTPGEQAIIAGNKQDAALNQAGRNAGRLEAPKYDSGDSVQAGYSGDLNPEMYGTPEDAQYSLAQDSAEGRAAQLAALQDMSRLTDQSAGSQSALGRNQAEMDARQLAQSREGAIRQDSMRRGKLGGTADMLSRQQAAQAASNQNLSAGMQNAQQAALMELAGTQAGASMAGQLRGQDQNMAFNNADIINKFNMSNTAERNKTSQANTQMMNAGNLRNLDAQQGFMDRQTGLGMAKLGRSDSNKTQGFKNEMGQLDAVNGVLTQKADAAQQQGEQSLKASHQASENFKDLMKLIGGGGGGMGG